MSEKTTVLVAINDEQKLTYLCDQLRADGYDASGAETVREARVRARLKPPALLLLGELQERHEALGLLRAIRAGAPEASDLDPRLGVILMAGDPGELCQLRAFEAGCDDCVHAGIAYPLLRARLAALLGRLAGVARAPRRVGALTVDPESRRVSYAGREVALSRLEFCLLDHLASDPERVFTKQELLRNVWGFICEGRTRTVDAHACRLRKKLTLAGARGFVVCVRGVGYRLTDQTLAPAAALPVLELVENGHAA